MTTFIQNLCEDHIDTCHEESARLTELIDMFSAINVPVLNITKHVDDRGFPYLTISDSFHTMHFTVKSGHVWYRTISSFMDEEIIGDNFTLRIVKSGNVAVLIYGPDRYIGLYLDANNIWTRWYNLEFEKLLLVDNVYRKLAGLPQRDGNITEDDITGKVYTFPVIINENGHVTDTGIGVGYGVAGLDPEATPEIIIWD